LIKQTRAIIDSSDILNPLKEADNITVEIECDIAQLIDRKKEERLGTPQNTSKHLKTPQNTSEHLRTPQNSYQREGNLQ
jgi:hypothetical protein